MKTTMILLSVVFVTFLVLPTNATIQYTTQSAHVIWVNDGDTFAFKISGDDREYAANLIGVDAAGWDERIGSCFALEAAKKLKSLIFEKDVTIKWDGKDQIDRRGRYLLYVEVDGLDVNSEMLRAGYAWVPRRFPADRRGEFIPIEENARSAEKGLWGICPNKYINDLLSRIKKDEDKWEKRKR